ncbi:MAG: TrkA family potassium uptake protein [Catenulispora sp.]|nr:TrkA family potassium uptake protein [Catenulispora sp.]
MNPAPLPAPAQRRAPSAHFVVCGHDGLAYRLAEQLTDRYDTDVVVLMTTEQKRQARGDFAEIDRVRVVVVERLDERTFAQADLAGAAGVALTVQDDVGNIHLALQAREVAPGLRIVVRMYNTSLAHGIEPLLGNCKVLSDSEIAAPALVASALREVAVNPVKVGQRTLIVARRADVPARSIVCAIANTTTHPHPHVLLADEVHADLVLADMQPEDVEATTRFEAVVKARRLVLARTFLGALVSRKSRIAATVVVAVIAAAALALGFSLDMSPGDTVYNAIGTAIGGIQLDEHYTTWQRVLQLTIGGAGLALIPLLTALVVEGMVRARLAVAQVRLTQPHSGHIVVAGLGGVGTRVLRLLHDRGVDVVAIAHDEQARGVPLARELNIPLVFGDPGRESTLRLAGVENARALMAITKSDASNLETALHGRNLQGRLHVVLRLFDGDLARRVRRTFNLPSSRSVSYLAAPAFAEALMDREVIGTISVERRVLLVASVVVAARSELDGARVADADAEGLVRVIALNEFGEPRPLWRPATGKRLRANDRLTIVGTRDGLSQLIKQAGAAAE